MVDSKAKCLRDDLTSTVLVPSQSDLFSFLPSQLVNALKTVPRLEVSVLDYKYK